MENIENVKRKRKPACVLKDPINLLFNSTEWDKPKKKKGGGEGIAEF